MSPVERYEQFFLTLDGVFRRTNLLRENTLYSVVQYGASYFIENIQFPCERRRSGSSVEGYKVGEGGTKIQDTMHITSSIRASSNLHVHIWRNLAKSEPKLRDRETNGLVVGTERV